MPHLYCYTHATASNRIEIETRSNPTLTQEHCQSPVSHTPVGNILSHPSSYSVHVKSFRKLLERIMEVNKTSGQSLQHADTVVFESCPRWHGLCNNWDIITASGSGQQERGTALCAVSHPPETANLHSPSTEMALEPVEWGF